MTLGATYECKQKVELPVTDVGYPMSCGVLSIAIDGAQCFDETKIVALRFRMMLCTVIVPGAMTSIVDDDIVAWANFRIVSETVDRIYNVGTGRRRLGISVFGAEETLDTVFWHAKVVG